MSTEKTIIEKIKAIVFGSEQPNETPSTQKFMDANLEDGTLIQVEPALEIGAAVVVLKEDGAVVPAEDATHTLADGTKVTTVEGIITEIMPKEEEVETEVEVEVPMATEPQADKVKKVVESIIKESHFARQDEVMTKEEVAKAISTMKEDIMKSLFEAFQAFAEEPIKQTTEKPLNKVKKERKGWATSFETKK